jgi:sulfoquinovose isomerase
VTLTTRDSRAAELRRLLAWGQASGSGAPPGFGYLGDDGETVPSEGLALWITTRMTHVYGLAALLGHPGSRELAARGVDALNGAFHDDTHGGWYAHLASTGEPVSTRKEMYGHAFVVLAGATASAAGLARGETLLERALDVIQQRFWDDEADACRESWDRTWQEAEPYGGVNANMHAVEAFLAAGAVTGQAVWSDRARLIAHRFIHGVARENRWRLPEHYTQTWDVLPEYNADQPRHRFRPYGVTIGHLLEWSRLLLHIERTVDPAPPWLLADAVALFDTAVGIGWAADGRPGFVYTVDWSDRPIVAERMHWVVAEGAMTAESLARRTGEEAFAVWAERLWSDAARFIDPEGGGWWHELDPEGAVSRTVWSGKPDLYHAVQALLLPDIPFTSSLVASVLAATP